MIFTSVKENQSWTVVKAVKTGFIQELLQEWNIELSIGMGSIPTTTWTREDSQTQKAGLGAGGSVDEIY